MPLLKFSIAVFIVISTSEKCDSNVETCQNGVKCKETSYMQERKRLLYEDWSFKTGSEIILNQNESALNSLLMKNKFVEVSQAIKSHLFPPSLPFFKAKPLIDNHSAVYRIIKRMPKGAALHLHDSSMFDFSWLIKNATYRPDCYMCFNTTSQTLRLKFFRKPPFNHDCEWRLVASVRQSYETKEEFDKMLFYNMTMITDDPMKAYPNEAAAWKRFYAIFDTVMDLIFYKDVFHDYFYQAMLTFHQDNVQHIEVRCLLSPPVYDLDGNVHKEEWIVQELYKLNQKFQSDHPDFSGMKLIRSYLRNVSASQVMESLKSAIEIRKKYPDFLVGYDLVGWEAAGQPLIHFINQLLYPSKAVPPIDMPYFFHAGETDWEGEPVDENLFDAILLNSSRIGHAYAIVKHPKLLELVKRKDIPIEVNPISNQVLRLVDDLRNHPAAYLIANNYSIVVSSDDPAVWGSDPLSHDFYEIFMGVAGVDADLRLLKRLAMDSIRYSAMSSLEKQAAFALWRKKWDKFIETTLHDFGL